MSTRSLFTLIGKSLFHPSPQITNSVRFISTTSCNYSRKKTDPFNNSAISKQAKNPFSAPPNSILAYVGPLAASLRQGKSLAFVFGACGCIAVPATLFLGNTEHLLATIGLLVSLSPSAVIHSLFRNDVTKIHVQGSTTIKAPTSVKVSATDALKLTFEKLSWRGVPVQTQVLSTDLFIKSESAKTVTWTTTSATKTNTAPTRNVNSKTTTTSPQTNRRELYRIDKVMMLNNPSFAFVMDQIEHQSRLSYSKHIATDTDTKK